MSNATIKECKMTIPTYEVGQEEKNPMFFEKRVYQGSSGKVYPYPVIEKIYDEPQNKEYDAVVLENDWLKVIVLPELGGRIYTAYDKTNNYDFVYHNRVIKPALVGLLGPWISGGIEFNWPQHHRPTTYMAVKHRVEENADGSVAVYIGEVEKMFSLEQTTCIKLYPDKAYIEITTNVYNRGQLPETFLWWANPAFRVNDDTRTIMPPDVTAVMDHGKRAVSTFPISTGEYYKYDYSSGIDISRYKNIFVPTSFMAYKSNFDFVGGYDYGRKAGLLHVADHHVSPGKKQWTWGAGDFGQAWDRNLTDEDGPYVELMTGCFTDNQPDFTYIQPQERKQFTQYFMPYHEVGEIRNANQDICFGFENDVLTVYSNIFAKAEIIVKKAGEVVYNKTCEFKPTESRECCAVTGDEEIIVRYNGKVLKYHDDMVEKFEIPDSATACPEPKECQNIEQLYLYGRHIEQYRHATRSAEDYYLEGLSRDSSDIRLNTAYGVLLVRRGKFKKAIWHLEMAINSSTVKNPNPINTEAYYYAGLAYFYLGEIDKTYDLIYKCVWSNEGKAMANYMLAVISYIRAEYDKAVNFARESIACSGHNIRAYILLGNALIKADKIDMAKNVFYWVDSEDKLDCQSKYELQLLKNEEKTALKGVSPFEATVYARDYIMLQEYAKAERILSDWMQVNDIEHPMVLFYIAYLRKFTGGDVKAVIKRAEKTSKEIVCFPNGLLDMIVLKELSESENSAIVYYYLGNWYYDKRRYEDAKECWEMSVGLDRKFPTALRNLALYFFNKAQQPNIAVQMLKKAYELDESDSRILMELNCLYEVAGVTEEERLALLDEHFDVASERDDLYTEYIKYTLHSGKARQAYDMICGRKFHPWEGGEGKVTKLYKEICIALAEEDMLAKRYDKAIKWYETALNYPENLGEGKLILDYDNDIYYLLGVAYESKSDNKKAVEMFNMATRGSSVVADDMYYNDNPIEYIYYQALAYKKLGDLAQAKLIADSFIGYASVNAGRDVKIDYFAVSLPDLLVWEQDLNLRNQKFCKYVRDLADKIMIG